MISVANIIKQVRIDVKDINEVKYSDWDIENATVLQHFEASNACNNKYATEGQIFGTFKLDSNGLVTEINQIFCS